MPMSTNLSKPFTPNTKLPLSHQNRTSAIPNSNNFNSPQCSPTQQHPSRIHLKCSISRPGTVSPCPATKITNLSNSKTLHGICYVVGDNIDTDQIIPTQYLTLVPSNPEEYAQLGAYALIGLPSTYTTRFLEPCETKSKYSILIAGANFGCGSSREHAPMALGAAGVNAIVAESYARILFRNCVSTGEVYPLESNVRICEECKTGHEVSIDLENCKLVNHTTGKEYKLKEMGDVKPVIEAGGIFAYARQMGMIKT